MPITCEECDSGDIIELDFQTYGTRTEKITWRCESCQHIWTTWFGW